MPSPLCVTCHASNASDRGNAHQTSWNRLGYRVRKTKNSMNNNNNSNPPGGSPGGVPTKQGPRRKYWRNRRGGKAKNNNNNNQLNKYGNMSKFTSPGSKAWSMIGTTPEVTGASAAWVKAALDPAHARDYGCIGIPDNNRVPTKVATSRMEYVVNEVSIPEGNAYCLVDLDGEHATWALRRPELVSGTKIKRITMYSHPCIGSFLHLEGSANSFSDGQLDYPHLFIALSQPNKDQCRPISMAHTIENVGSWSNMGGFFTAGHLPLDRDYESGEDIAYVLGSEDSISSYVTYQGGSAAGVYNICRMRNLDAATFFADRVAAKVIPSLIGESAETSATASAPTLSVWNQLVSAWEWSFSTYTCVTESFTLRITEYWNYEFTSSYQDGGADGARYDKAALEFVLSILDQHAFVFEAAANDGRKLASRLRLILHKYKGAILAAMSAAGAPQWVTTVAGTVINGIANGK